jgi:predicted nucleotidyltransferase
MSPLDQVAGLTANERAALGEYLARLREACGNQVFRVVLFGSKARGDSEPESDIDLFLVLHGELDGLKRAIDGLSYEISLNHGVVLSDLVVDERRYHWMKQHREPILVEIEREGIELWRIEKVA